MEIQEIEVEIDPHGNVVVHVQGVKGEACLSLTEGLEAALGQVESREATPEAYEAPLHVEQRNWA